MNFELYNELIELIQKDISVLKAANADLRQTAIDMQNRPQDGSEALLYNLQHVIDPAYTTQK